MKTALLSVAFALGLAGASRDGTVNTAPVAALPKNAFDGHSYFQPAIDFDTDSCYNVPAVDASGNVDKGLPATAAIPYSKNCRDASDLNNQNVYSRSRCNTGWCVFLYAYYFEKDDSLCPGCLPHNGHRFDWEHIALWATYNERDSNGYPIVKWIAFSKHGGYNFRRNSEMHWEGTHPKLVYHKDGGLTHCWREATPGDEPPENHWKIWIKGALLSFTKMPAVAKNAMKGDIYGDGYFGLLDDRFADTIKRSKPSEVNQYFDFNNNGADCAAKMEKTGYC